MIWKTKQKFLIALMLIYLTIIIIGIIFWYNSKTQIIKIEEIQDNRSKTIKALKTDAINRTEKLVQASE